MLVGTALDLLAAFAATAAVVVEVTLPESGVVEVATPTGDSGIVAMDVTGWGDGSNDWEVTVSGPSAPSTHLSGGQKPLAQLALHHFVSAGSPVMLVHVGDSAVVAAAGEGCSVVGRWS